MYIVCIVDSWCGALDGQTRKQFLKLCQMLSKTLLKGAVHYLLHLSVYRTTNFPVGKSSDTLNYMYKKLNTINFLVAITPLGVICFNSK